MRHSYHQGPPANRYRYRTVNVIIDTLARPNVSCMDGWDDVKSLPVLLAQGAVCDCT